MIVESTYILNNDDTYFYRFYLFELLFRLCLIESENLGINVKSETSKVVWSCLMIMKTISCQIVIVTHRWNKKLKKREWENVQNLAFMIFSIAISCRISFFIQRHISTVTREIIEWSFMWAVKWTNYQFILAILIFSHQLTRTIRTEQIVNVVTKTYWIEKQWKLLR
jgi:hypothetical protein